MIIFIYMFCLFDIFIINIVLWYNQQTILKTFLTVHLLKLKTYKLILMMNTMTFSWKKIWVLHLQLLLHWSRLGNFHILTKKFKKYNKKQAVLVSKRRDTVAKENNVWKIIHFMLWNEAIVLCYKITQNWS
jgi:hypothetical protein